MRLEKDNLIIISYFVVLILFHFFITYELITTDPIFKYDDINLATIYHKINGVQDYISKIFTRHVKDIQPIRDITFIINSLILKWFKLSTFHFLNFVLTIFFFFSVYKFFINEKINKYLAMITTSVISLNPIYITSTAWLSARKHTLAGLFILWAVISFRKSNRLNYKVIALYLFSILSNPITIFTAIYFGITHIKEKNKDLIKPIFLLFIFTIVLFLNYYKGYQLNYYNSDVVDMGIADKISNSTLSIMRSFQLVFLPFKTSINYFRGSIWNMVGGVCLFIWIIFLFKHKDFFRNFSLQLAILLLIPTMIAFVNDTYLFTTSVFLIFPVVKSLPKLISSRKAQCLIGVILLSYLGCISFVESKKWRSEKDLFLYSYLLEKDPVLALYVSSHTAKSAESSFYFLEEGMKGMRDELSGRIQVLFLSSLYKIDSKDLNRKMRILKKFWKEKGVYIFYKNLILLKMTKDLYYLNQLDQLILSGVDFDMTGLISLVELCNQENNFNCRDNMQSDIFALLDVNTL